MQSLARTLLRRAFSTAPLSNAPLIVALAPCRVPVEEGKAYFWCACGHTRTEPWCDGSHKALSTIRPVKWVAPKSGTANVCACRHTKREGRVLCDGGHVFLPRASDGEQAGSGSGSSSGSGGSGSTVAQGRSNE